MVASVDSYELKFTVPDGQERAVVEAMDLDPLDAQIRQIYFFDTPKLELSAAGIVLRARRIQGRDHDAVVKLRPVEPGAIPATWRDDDALTVEVDMVGDEAVCSASLKAARKPELIKAVVSGDKPIEELFAKRQLRFLEELAPARIDWSTIRVLGPVNVHKLKTVREPLGMKVAVELWRYPDDTYLLELSTRVAPEGLFEAHRRVRGRLEEVGFGIEGNQETKTKRALAYFAEQLLAGE